MEYDDSYKGVLDKWFNLHHRKLGKKPQFNFTSKSDFVIVYRDYPTATKQFFDSWAELLGQGGFFLAQRITGFHIVYWNI